MIVDLRLSGIYFIREVDLTPETTKMIPIIINNPGGMIFE